jgi:hypothetical protein
LSPSLLPIGTANIVTDTHEGDDGQVVEIARQSFAEKGAADTLLLSINKRSTKSNDQGKKLDQDPSDSTGVSTTTSTLLDYLVSFPTDEEKKVLLYLVEQ